MRTPQEEKQNKAEPQRITHEKKTKTLKKTKPKLKRTHQNPKKMRTERGKPQKKQKVKHRTQPKITARKVQL